jgi:hypothetical protein
MWDWVQQGFQVVWKETGQPVPEALLDILRGTVERKAEATRRNAAKPPLTAEEAAKLQERMEAFEREATELLAERRSLQARYPNGIPREIGEPFLQRWNAMKEKLDRAARGRDDQGGSLDRTALADVTLDDNPRKKK